jgi:hypothetical protein
MLLGVAYLFAAVICSSLAGRGGPGWLYMFIVLFVYNGFKFLLFGPVSLLLLMRARALDHRHGPGSTSR